MTFLQLINRVLRGLRENQVTAITAESTRMIAQLVNEAKTDIEDMGPWDALRSTHALALGVGENTVVVGSTNERSYICLDSCGNPQAFVETAGSERRLEQLQHDDMRALRILNPDADAGTPLYFSIVRDEAGLSVSVWPDADVAYSLRVDLIVPQDDLDAAADEPLIPSEPIWREALVRAMEERGEEFAGPLERQSARARESLFAAILRDFGAHAMTFEAL